jgi:hypothetical protein
MSRRQGLYHVNYLAKFSEDLYNGSYEIVQVNTNGTVHLQIGDSIGFCNIQLLNHTENKTRDVLCVTYDVQYTLDVEASALYMMPSQWLDTMTDYSLNNES